jgi:hypothetical protein
MHTPDPESSVVTKSVERADLRVVERGRENRPKGLDLTPRRLVAPLRRDLTADSRYGDAMDVDRAADECSTFDNDCDRQIEYRVPRSRDAKPQL